MKKLLVLTLSSSIYSTTTHAIELTSNDWYVGALYSFQKLDIKGVDTLGINNAGITAGYKYDEVFSLEYRHSTSISSDSLTYPTPRYTSNSSEQEIDYQIGLLAKAAYDITPKLSIYGLAGYDKTKVHLKEEGNSTDFNGNITSSFTKNYAEHIEGFTYGLGFNYQLSNELTFFIDYQVLPELKPPHGAITTSRDSANLGVYYAF